MKTCGVDLENTEKYQELFKLVQNAQKKQLLYIFSYVQISCMFVPM